MSEKTFKFNKQYDIVVAGAGIAGVAAALAAKRYGMNVVLVEKTVFAGGLATAGNILAYMPLSDAWGNQVTFGIAEELLLASLKYGPCDVPQDWRDPKTKSQYKSWFNPASFILALDEILEKAGVDIWFDTLICDTQLEGNRITAIEVENKSGRGIIYGKCFVDATGDADVAYKSGAECIEHDNFLSIWCVEASLETAKKVAQENNGTKLLSLVIKGSNDCGIGHPENMKKYCGTNSKDVTEFILESRKLVREHYKKKQLEAGINRKNNIFPVKLPAMADFRTTRRIAGKYTLKTGEYHKHFDDCIGVVADWRGGRQIWELPYRCLYTQNVKGLLAAGRCISTEGQAWEVMRAIQASAMSGEVCGIAASMSVEYGITPDVMNLDTLKKELADRNFLLDVRECKDAIEESDNGLSG